MNAHSAEGDAGQINPELVLALAAELDGHVDEDTVSALTDALSRAGLAIVARVFSPEGDPV